MPYTFAQASGNTTRGKTFWRFSETSLRRNRIHHYEGENCLQRAIPKKKSASKARRLAFLVASSECEICFADREAKHWLNQFFGRPSRARLLPRKVCRWLVADHSALGAKSLIVKRDDARLFITRQVPHPPHSVSLLLELVKGDVADFARKHRALTRRENEVLYWLGHGKSNHEIAEILAMATATVSKHLERIYPKLGVENRTAAAHFTA
jgi:DNA-binding CsgD family transcriptional regulator